MYTDQAIFTQTYYSLEESLIDFSKPFDLQNKSDLDKRLIGNKSFSLWNGLPRDSIFTIKVATFDSAMTSNNYNNFTILMAFISEIFVPEKSQESQREEKKNWQKNEEAKNRHLLNELKERGIDDTLKYIETQIRIFESEFPLQKNKSSIFEISLKKVSLTLLKGAEPHFVFSIVDFIKRDVYDSTGRVEVSYSIKKLNISHLKSEDPSSTEMLRRISEKTSKDKMLYINQVYYYVDGRHKQNRWLVNKNYEVFVAPVIIRLSPDIYTFITEFFFSSSTNPKDPADKKDALKTDDLHQKVPTPLTRCWRTLTGSSR